MWQLPTGAALIELNDSWRTVITVGSIVLAFVLGIMLSRSIRMREYGAKLGAIFAVVAFGSCVCLFNQAKKGIDLSGGTILIYQIDTELSQNSGEEQVGQADDNDIDMSALVDALKKRIDPTGVREIKVRPYGPTQVEIIVPRASDAEIESLKRTIAQTGFLKFRIVASPRRHPREFALGQTTLNSSNPDVLMSKKIVDSDGTVVAEWVRLKVSDGHTPEAPKYKLNPLQLSHETLTRELVPGEMEILMVVDRNERLHVEGGHLGSVSKSFDESMRPCVNFRMNRQGARLFGLLTETNLPDEQSGSAAHLAIIMDDEVLSAPSIRSKISGQGEITGDFREQEVKELVSVLKAGRLPAVLRPEPISINNISPLLGLDTIKKGRFAISLSLGMVLVFMLAYYHFAGIVACLALIVNLILIVAVMITIDAAFTLPGLAGLVLTVGMSVDANVLIFERIREETRRGAALRRAIQNGFDRATTTIVDANITTLITALVLYAIGTDQLRGFAITLILGILMSMFTAIFCSRAIFEIFERKEWIKKLGMVQIIGEKDWNFLKYRSLAAAISLTVILFGLIAVSARGRQIFDIDFNGGTSVQAILTQAMPIAEVRQKLSGLVDEEGNSIDISITEVQPEGMPRDTVYKIDTSIESEDKLHQKLQDVFQTDMGTQLKTHSMEFSEPAFITSGAAMLPGNSMWDLTPIPSRQPRLIAQVDTTADPTTTSDATGDGTNAKADVAFPADGTKDTVDGTAGLSDEQIDAANKAATESAAGGIDASATPSSESIQQKRQKIYRTTSTLTFDEEINGKTLRQRVLEAATTAGQDQPFVDLKYPATVDGETKFLTWNGNNADTHSQWMVNFSTGIEPTRQTLQGLKQELDVAPAWLSSSKIGSTVAGKMKTKAIAAIVVSLIGIIAYIWIRFQRVAFGVAAVVALVHDVLITLGAIGASLWLANIFGFLMVEEFKISLPVVAAFLTIVGYSLNDTIVVFDRIREVRGKSPTIREEMINTSINQTLSRTLLTSTTTLIVVLILYCLGGQGIHGFAFALLVGVLVGTYSSIFVASPALLWLTQMADRRANASKPQKKDIVAATR